MKGLQTCFPDLHGMSFYFESGLAEYEGLQEKLKSQGAKICDIKSDAAYIVVPNNSTPTRITTNSAGQEIVWLCFANMLTTPGYDFDSYFSNS